MNNIPKKLREEMAEDPFMRSCCISDHWCEGKIEWHHVILFAGRQLQKKFAIVPACQHHHRIADKKDIKDRFLRVVLGRATNQEIREISVAIDYFRERDRLSPL